MSDMTITDRENTTAFCSGTSRMEIRPGGIPTFHPAGPVGPVVSMNTTDALIVLGEDGRVLLRIGRDRTVDGAIEDMGEAARIFIEKMRAFITLDGPGAP